MLFIKNVNKQMNCIKQSCCPVANQKIFHSTKDPPLFFIMMRLNVKFTLLCLIIIGCFTLLILWSICGDRNQPDWHRFINNNNNRDRYDDLQGAEEIDCDINHEYVIGCRKEGDEVYLPFSFLHKYFQIYGKLTTYDGLERFEWSHSYSKIYHPKGKYDPKGVFMYFENYNVEVRDRVKCVSGIDGVPISIQWSSHGYYYPTQIAQFGLSHYSKNLTEPEPRWKCIEDGGDREIGKWIIPDGCNIARIYDENVNSRILKFRTSEIETEYIQLKMEHVLDFVISLNILLGVNSSFSVVLQNRETKDIYNLHYITSNIPITAQDNNIYHGIGITTDWKRLTRDLIIDLQKGLNYLDKDKSKHKIPKSKLKIINIILRGYGSIDNLTISTSEHIQQFYDAAEWFVRNQNNRTGGWNIPVKRRLSSRFHDLQPGWLSAMGQGHAISVLSRAYYHSGGDLRYLNAAINALKPFNITSDDGGILALFLNKYNWYEEYPTKPSSFVLNGFIYSLLGLYDLMIIAPNGYADDAKHLFYQGMQSLKGMLLFYDMGSVTSYDLRHISLGIAPNLARWDYHATHINQLLLLSTIDNDPLFTQTAERWIGYMSGRRAAHN